ncbi:MAG: hypothetical protein LUC86_03025 [Prevotellaceae bacterium]|nr:hypothetical protein [Prevotellaceae bacterium]MCD8303788.1 hypothetical protein [Prevotellaceae bacterium]
MKKEKVNDINREPHKRTPEEWAELRARVPKLNKLGEWIFSNEPKKKYFIIKNLKAVMK